MVDEVPKYYDKPHGFTLVVHGWPPTWNHAYKMIAIGRHGAKHASLAKTKEATGFQYSVLETAINESLAWWIHEFRMSPRPLSFEVVYVGDWRLKKDEAMPKGQDVLNMTKLLEDAVSRALGYDDKWHDRVTILRRHDESQTLTIVTVTPHNCLPGGLGLG